MMILKKAFAIVSIIIVTLAISVIPCFAQVNDGNTDQIEYMNAYCSSISVDGYTVVNNLYEGDSFFEGSFSNFDFTADTSSSSYSNIFNVDIFSLGYLSNAEIVTHFVIDPFFVDKSSAEYWPSISLQISDDGLNSTASTFFVINYRVIDTATQNVTDSYLNGYLTTGSPLINLRSLLSSSVSDGDILEISVTTTTTIESARNLYIQTGVNSRAVNYFVGGFVDIVTGSFNIVDYIGNTVDSFFDVEIFDGVTIGNLFLIVIAVPALIAVLRMLGGVG